MTAPLPLVARGGAGALAGSLWLPGGAPRALVLMHPGSGPSDRDNDVFFPPIRAALLAAGAAVASYDKRGVGESEGSWLTADIADQADDAAAGLRAARTALAGVPGEGGTGRDVPVVLFGHSQGGWVVLEAAARPDLRDDVAGVATSSGPAVTPGAQERFSTATLLRRAGRSGADAERALAVFDGLMALAERGASFDEARAWSEEPGRRAALDGLAELGAFVPGAPEVWGLATRIVGHDPVHALRSLDAPLLAVFGGDDGVVPVERSVAVLRGTVGAGLLDVAVLAGGDRRLQDADDAFVPGYPDVVVDFVRRVAADA
ncbi:alpha/beta fold hydrolase [Luteimicrobium sp. NPDC057192]|uniref:alpha/beta fold hydrolase n=1 Tax=Luteimicrobium sp. NPDC057192 TaxID=3346042 RepID=UPI0036304A30